MKRKNKVIVVKFGSSTLVGEDRKIRTELLYSLADQIAELLTQGYGVIIVSSGAVACGGGPLGSDGPMRELRRAASIGQPILIECWRKAFKRYELKVGQHLLTDQDLKESTIGEDLLYMLKCGEIPVVNANDAVSSKELEALRDRGDNDDLAASIAINVKADRLIILTDVDGVDSNYPNGSIIPEVTDISQVEHLIVNTGQIRPSGMLSKFEAFKRVMPYGIRGELLNGNCKDGLRRALSGESPGTVFLPQS